MPTRRLFAYWLMILLPSLAIGGLALHYIRHEKDLLAAQQRASLSDQGRRAAEDILLLVENLQYGLVLSLENLPDEERATTLRKLHRTDPLVRQVFLFNDREQRVVLPDAKEMERPEVQAFIRRYDALFTGRIPWFPGTAPDPEGIQPADTNWLARPAEPSPASGVEAVPASAPAPAASAPGLGSMHSASQIQAMPPAPSAPVSAELSQNVILVQLDETAPAGGEPGAIATDNTTNPSKKVDLANSAKGALFRQIWNEYSPNANRQQQQRLAEPEAQTAQQRADLAPAATADPEAGALADSGLSNAPEALAARTVSRYESQTGKPMPAETDDAEGQALSLGLNGLATGASAPVQPAPEKPLPALAKAKARNPEGADHVYFAQTKDLFSATESNATVFAGMTVQLGAVATPSESDALLRFSREQVSGITSADGSLASQGFADPDSLQADRGGIVDSRRRTTGAAHPVTVPPDDVSKEDKRAPPPRDEPVPAVAANPAPPPPRVAATKPAAAREVAAITGGISGDLSIGGRSGSGEKTKEEVTELAKSDLSGERVWDHGRAGAERSDGPSSTLAGLQKLEDFKQVVASDGRKLGEKRDRMESRGEFSPEKSVAPVALPQPLPSLRNGWRPWYWENAFHLLGFVQDAARGETFGVELELLALLSRLPAALDGGTTAAFVLRDQQGETYFRSRPVEEREAPVDVFNLGPSLAFFELAVYPSDPRGAAGLARTSFLAMAMLVGAFLVSIASGGGLLIAQARASWREALQKTSFVSNVSHELKTPLTTLRMYTEMLRGGKLAEEKRAQYLDVMLSESERLSRLVGNVLDFSRLEQGRKKYQMEPLDLGEHAGRVVEASRVVFERPELGLTFVPATGPVPVRADPDALEQILLNLLDNAAKYGCAGGEIRVAVSRRGGRAIVDVLDRGPGVPVEHRSRIFDKFHRVDESLTAEQGGCGLGLSIARRLARDHGGDIICEGRPGGGAAFRLQLPAAEETRT